MLEMPGIEPGASYMQSMRSTTELHPRIYVCTNILFIIKRKQAFFGKYVLHFYLYLHLEKWRNALLVNIFLTGFTLGDEMWIIKIRFVRCGVRTHAILRLWELKSHALDHSANLTVFLMIKIMITIKTASLSQCRIKN